MHQLRSRALPWLRSQDQGLSLLPGLHSAWNPEHIAALQLRREIEVEGEGETCRVVRCASRTRSVYNRQNVKAVVHFVGTVGLFQLTNLHVLPGFFALAGMAFYIHSIIDAYRTAQRIAEGESPEADEAKFKRQLAKRAPALGLLFIVAGLLLVIQIIKPWAFITPARLIPAALIIFGGYLLTSYFKRSREEEYNGDQQRPSYPLIPDSFAENVPSNVRRMSRPGDRR